MLAIDQLCKSYSGHIVLQTISHEFQADRTTAVVGPSGCGKTTLLRLLLGLVEPDSGVVTYDGTALTTSNADEIRHKIGYVIQDGGLFPHLTARDNITLLAKYLGLSGVDINARLAELSELMQISSDVYANLLGCEYIEKHFCLERATTEYDGYSALEPEQMEQLCIALRQAAEASSASFICDPEKVYLEIQSTSRVGPRSVVNNRGNLKMSKPMDRKGHRRLVTNSCEVEVVPSRIRRLPVAYRPETRTMAGSLHQVHLLCGVVRDFDINRHLAFPS